MKHMYMRRFVAAFAFLTLVAGGLAVAAGGGLRLRAHLVAPVTAGDVSGKAKFRDRDERRKFSVQIEGFMPGLMFDVMVSGVTVGTITIDELGIGNLDFDDTADPDDLDLPFPANFPALDGGELVEVGPLDGTLQLK